jgi:hypothetical protein
MAQLPRFLRSSLWMPAAARPVIIVIAHRRSKFLFCIAQFDGR